MLVFECVARSVMCGCELGGGLVVQADTDTPGVLDINKTYTHLYIYLGQTTLLALSSLHGNHCTSVVWATLTPKDSGSQETSLSQVKHIIGFSIPGFS